MFIIFITKIDFVLSRFWIWQPRAKSINGSSASATILWWSRTRTSTFSSARVSTNPVKRRTKWRPSASTSSSRKRPIWLDYCSYYSLLLLFLIYSRKSSGRILSININRLSLLLITDYLILNDLRSIYSICCSYWCWQFDWIVAVICCCCYLEYRQKKIPPMIGYQYLSCSILVGNSQPETESRDPHGVVVLHALGSLLGGSIRLCFGIPAIRFQSGDVAEVDSRRNGCRFDAPRHWRPGAEHLSGQSLCVLVSRRLSHGSGCTWRGRPRRPRRPRWAVIAVQGSF